MVKIMIVDNHSLMRRAIRDVIAHERDLSVVAEARNGGEAETLIKKARPDVILMDLNLPDRNGFDTMECIRTYSPAACIVIFTASHQERHVFQALLRGAMGYLTKDVEADALVHAIRCAARNDLCIPAALASNVMASLRTIWQAQEPSTLSDPPNTHVLHEDKGLTFSQPFTDYWPALPDITTCASAVAYKAPRHFKRIPRSTGLQDPSTTMPHQPRPLTYRELEILALIRKGHKNREIAQGLCIAESTVQKHVQNILEKLHARNRTEAIYLTSSVV